MLQNDTAVFHAFAWNPVKAEYNDWRGMGTRAAIAVRGFEAQGPVHYCPKEWLQEGWLDKPKGRQFQFPKAAEKISYRCGRVRVPTRTSEADRGESSEFHERAAGQRVPSEN